MYRDDENMRNVIDKHDVNTLFNDAWDCVPRFKRLRTFCGGLATIFPNMMSVESNFSILKWELDAFRTALMHLSLEGIMQAKQRAILKQLWAWWAIKYTSGRNLGHCAVRSALFGPIHKLLAITTTK